MNNKHFVILTVLAFVSLIWLKWIILPAYGSNVLTTTTPFYLTFIEAAWCLGYVMSEGKSAKRVRVAEDWARFAVQTSNDIMNDASAMSEFYSGLGRSIDEGNKLNRKERDNIKTERKAIAEEMEALISLRSDHKDYEELSMRLKNCEKDKIGLQEKLKRLKRNMQIEKTEDESEISV
ncbi:hypothetical protein KOM00_07360 [Geomonas sp. Red69]|uniref:hypothetical protein n=1 Tax=Geomonas diazotrophica TaxID=2843197 RepID=UPI001C11B5FC|nr:hypothetical protein [Geomonas diazotrophica]MBU5636553.1 hypothetical protein [Geomonas diazotrophica]